MTTRKVYIYPDFFARFLKHADWQPAEYDGQPPSGAIRATHEAEFSFAGKTVRALLLTDGEAVLSLEDLARLFGVTADELNTELNKIPQDLPAGVEGGGPHG